MHWGKRYFNHVGECVIRRKCRDLSNLILFAGLLAGCTALPNTTGYTVATIQVQQAVAATGEIIVAERDAAINAGATTDKNESVKKLNAGWKQTVNSLDAMVAYAQSIEQIVDAGNNGAESAKKVADSVKTLVDKVKVDPMSGAAAEMLKLSTDTVAFVYGEYSKYSAAKSLEEAFARSGPSMMKISALIQSQVAEGKRLFDEQIQAQILELQSDSSGYGAWIKKNDETNAQAQIAVSALTKLIGTNREADIKKVKTLLADIDLAHTQIAPRIAEYESKLHAIGQRDKVGRSVLGAAENAIVAWGAAHQQLVDALKERRPVSLESLVAATTEIRSLTQQWREL